MKQHISVIIITQICIIISILSFNSIQAQVKIDTLLASQYYQKADSLLHERKYETSLKFFKQALPLYKKVKTWKKVVSCYSKLSHNKWRIGNINASKKDAETALKIISAHQLKDTEDEAYAYNNIGFYYEKLSDYDNTIIYRLKALKIRQQIFPENHLKIAQSYGYLARIYSAIAEYDKAITFYKKEVNIYLKITDPYNQKIGNTYFNIGGIYSSLDQPKKALEYYKKFSEISIKNYGEDHLYIGYSYVNKGSAYEKIKQNDKALQQYQQALTILTREKDNYGLNMLYKNFGALMYENKEYDKALQYYQQCLQIGLEIYGENNPEIGDNYANISSVLTQTNDYENALLYNQKALQVYEGIYGKNHDKIAVQYRNFASMYSLKKEYDTALAFLTKSLNITKNMFGEHHIKTAQAYVPLGQLYIDKCEYDKALSYFRKSLEMHKTAYGVTDLRTSDLQNHIAEVYYKQQKYDESIASYDNAILANTKDSKKSDNKSLDLHQYYNLEILLTSLKGKASVLASRYKHNHKKQDILQSVAIYNKIPLIIDKVRQSFQNYEDKLSLVKLGKEIYADAITAQLLLYEDSQKEENLEKALFYAEKSKANILKELLADMDAKEVSGLPAALLEIEKNLKTDKAYYQSKIIEVQSKATIDSSKIKRYENELFDINRRQDSLLLVLEKNYPKYYQLKHKNAVIKLKGIQKNLDKKTTLISFFTLDSSAYAFTVTKNDIVLKEIATPRLTENIETLRNAIIAMDIHAFKTTSNILYTQLIAPLKDHIKGDELIIIPDGPLWHLNFDLLLTKQDTSDNPRKLSYLLRDYAITHANSATLLFTPFQSKSPGKKQPECLAFSFSDSTALAKTGNTSMATLRNSIDDLPGTREEIQNIATIIDGQYFYGSEAVEANFKKNAGKYKMLHLALHGAIDNEHPQNSKLYFTKIKDTLEDNVLYAHELFALDIPAELTVLSACNTGSGKIAAGEGIMSLGNAFQYAGTQSLLLTSWEVSDQTTPILMEKFYKNLKEGMTKGKALQQAKLEFLNTANAIQTDPFYWGGFYLVGNSAAIDLGSSTFLYWFLGFASIAILAGCLFLYKRKSS
ncbi:CHAT domain-containing protein [Aquimarina pacifica]|uniref:CHAT domain-containing protein n=1 Tax=Aquimarina pacifica TaxID=1296415 RepID=UPI000471308E|nr:CHAT domain-containing tetratricopeptide repeat protein [Aquimarina pacifica]